jgi:hypothetical protein
VGGTAVFIGMLAGEAAIFTAFLFTGISWLWYNVLGCATVVATALVVTWLTPGGGVPAQTATPGMQQPG